LRKKKEKEKCHWHGRHPQREKEENTQHVSLENREGKRGGGGPIILNKGNWLVQEKGNAVPVTTFQRKKKKRERRDLLMPQGDFAPVADKHQEGIPSP